MRLIFIAVHILLGIFFLKAGVEPYWQGGGSWDAGVLPLFVAFWFFFAGFGFYKKNIWLVSMSSLALVGFLALYLFIEFLEYFQTGFKMAPEETNFNIAGLAVVGFLMAGQVYAIWRFRRTDAGSK